MSATKNCNRTFWYMGHRFTLLANAAETGGKFALFEAMAQAGQEPPAHVHTNEDEFFYIVEGEGLFTTGNVTYHAKPGDLVWFPKAVPHMFRILTETAKMLVGIIPGAFEEFFLHFARPAEGPGLPPPIESPYAIEEIITLGNRLGITFIPPVAESDAIEVPHGPQLAIFGNEWDVLTGQPGMTILEWTCPKEGGLPRHRHLEAMEGLYVLEGQLLVEVEGEPTRILNPGEFALLPPGIPHLHTAFGDSKSRTIQFLSPGGVEDALAEAMIACATAPETLPVVALKHGIELLP